MDFIADMLGKRGGKPQEYADIVYGVVKSVTPLEISFDPQKPNLPESLLELSKRVQKYQLNIGGQLVEVDESLAVDDRVVMLRRDGGKRFFVLEKR